MRRGAIRGTTLSLLLCAGLCAASLALRKEALERSRPKLPPADPTAAGVAKIDALIEQHWKSSGVTAVPVAADYLVARRLTLALCGTVPSLQELRWLEQQPPTERIAKFTDRLLADPRSHFYLAERFARATNSSLPAEPFFVYRRRRFVFWLAEEIGKRRPYDELVRDMIAGEGVWTDKPGVNYLTGHDIDPIKLAGRTTRAFLGLRLDCAQCHDHPFAPWKQRDFEGFAAWFSNAHLGWRGVVETPGPTLVEDSAKKTPKAVTPTVPYQPELLPADGNLRERFAGWATHPDNKFFARALANRLWTLMFGRGLAEPIDNLENPAAVPGVLEALAEELRTHRFDIQHGIRVIAGLKAFRLQSAFQTATSDEQESAFAAFPTVRLRPEQAAGGLVQASRLFTIDDRTSALMQATAFGAQNDFVERYGDFGEDEMTPHDGNVAQRLLLMNGKVAHDQIKADLATSCRHLAELAPDNAAAVRLAFLVTLSRIPSAEESAHFAATLGGEKDATREERLEDLFWALVNSTEFSWNR